MNHIFGGGGHGHSHGGGAACNHSHRGQYQQLPVNEGDDNVAPAPDQHANQAVDGHAHQQRHVAHQQAENGAEPEVDIVSVRVCFMLSPTYAISSGDLWMDGAEYDIGHAP